MYFLTEHLSITPWVTWLQPTHFSHTKTNIWEMSCHRDAKFERDLSYWNSENNDIFTIFYQIKVYRAPLWIKHWHLYLEDHLKFWKQSLNDGISRNIVLKKLWMCLSPGIPGILWIFKEKYRKKIHSSNSSLFGQRNYKYYKNRPVWDSTLYIVHCTYTLINKFEILHWTSYIVHTH